MIVPVGLPFYADLGEVLCPDLTGYLGALVNIALAVRMPVAIKALAAILGKRARLMVGNARSVTVRSPATVGRKYHVIDPPTSGAPLQKDRSRG